MAWPIGVRIWSIILNTNRFIKLIIIAFAGSHGDGSASETEIPIVTWGAGLSYANKQSTSKPVNIEQADVAPLMATLIGVPVPVHSVVRISFKIWK